MRSALLMPALVVLSCSPSPEEEPALAEGALPGEWGANQGSTELSSPALGEPADEESTMAIVEEAGPSVAAIHVSLEGVEVHPLAQPRRQEGGGSGFVMDEEGRVITNYHVVSSAMVEGTTDLRPEAEVEVSFLEEPEERHPVRVHGANPDFDLALLALEDEAVDVPEPLPLADSEEVEPGQKAVAIGSPFGLHSTVTSGIVSAVERERPGLVGIEIPFIQTDAAINPGNSGGPLLDSGGRVVGINNAILAAPMGPRGFIGVGFAVPSNLLRESAPELAEGGLSGVAAALPEIPDRPRIGLTAALTVEDYPQGLRERLGLPEHGVVVTGVSAGGPAEEAGLVTAPETAVVAGRPYPMGGDIITEVEGEALHRLIELQRVVLDREEGDTVELTVWRDGEERSVEVTLQVVT